MTKKKIANKSQGRQNSVKNRKKVVKKQRFDNVNSLLNSVLTTIKLTQSNISVLCSKREIISPDTFKKYNDSIEVMRNVEFMLSDVVSSNVLVDVKE